MEAGEEVSRVLLLLSPLSPTPTNFLPPPLISQTLLVPRTTPETLTQQRRSRLSMRSSSSLPLFPPFLLSFSSHSLLFSQNLTRSPSSTLYPSQQAPTCLDPTHCSRLLDEKWRQAYLSANRFGSPQPSIVYRYLRQLDVPPFLMLERSACDQFARGWVLDRESGNWRRRKREKENETRRTER